MLLLFGLAWMAGISVATAYWAALTVSLPASIGVLATLIYLSWKDRLTEAAIVNGLSFGVLAATAIYFVWYLVTLYAGADAHTTLIEKLVMPLGVLGPVAIVGLCWGSFTAAASYVPFRFIAFKREEPLDD